MLSALATLRRGPPADPVSGWSLATLVLGLFLIGPFVALLYAMTGDSGGLWSHLMETVFPRYVANTMALMAGVGLVSLAFGLSTAWLVTRYEFPFSRLLDWTLLLPATVPAYIIAYAYTDLLEYAGPVQGLLRDIFGWSSARDYWFPEIRSLGGAVLVMGSVLYPYVYLMARTAFRLTPASYYEVALLHDRNIAFSVGIPLARPAIVAGLALVLMEVVSDFGTVEYFAVETLTLGIFNVWLGMNNLTAAAQIAGVAFVFILGLLFIERRARGQQRFFDPATPREGLRPVRLSGAKAALCVAVCLAPLILGFAVPVGVLAWFVAAGLSSTDYGALVTTTVNSLAVALAAAAIVMGVALVTVMVTAYKRHPALAALTAVSAMGYAFPGTVLAIGVVVFAGALDSAAEALVEGVLGAGFHGLLIGGVALLVAGYVVRFQAIGYGAMVSGVKRLSPNIMNASYVLGRGFSRSLVTLAPPLLRKSILAGGLLVFVDVMKELPMTLLLRPFDFETLATYVYQFATDELLEHSALAALAIVAAGLGPVIWMNASQRR
ncbi:MAG: iron ABC transporter permease [Defluviicoccus sp.]|nr:iron ABC transporter permease [Defluviicoccus sp.]